MFRGRFLTAFDIKFVMAMHIFSRYPIGLGMDIAFAVLEVSPAENANTINFLITYSNFIDYFKENLL